MFGFGLLELMILLVIFFPFLINGFLAKSRGKSVLLMLLLTIFFSWIITLILGLMSPKESVETT